MSFECLFGALIVVPFLLGFWIRRWWFPLLPVALFGAAIAFAMTLSDDPGPEYEAWSASGYTLVITIIFSIPMVLGALLGTIVGIIRKRRLANEALAAEKYAEWLRTNNRVQHPP